MQRTRPTLIGPLIALGLVAVSVMTSGSFSARPQVAHAVAGDVTQIAGGHAPYSPPNPAGPIPGDQVWFAVYAEMIEEHAGFLYIRDIEGIDKVDEVTGTTERIVGTGYGTVPAASLPVDGVPAAGVGIN